VLYRRSMQFELNQTWVEAVCAFCDPVFASADVEFVRQMQFRRSGSTVFEGARELSGLAQEVALLWEAEPQKFATQYPDCGLVESYGESWPPPCIDFWAYIDGSTGRARLRVEGWGVDEIQVSLVGEGAHDGLGIARQFALILRVPVPPSP